MNVLTKTIALVSWLAVAVACALGMFGCYKCVDAQCSNVPNVEPDYPPSSGIVEVFPDGSEAAAKSPCGLACENFRKLGCVEGDETKGGVSCYRVCLHAASLRKLPTTCWTKATTPTELRSCGQVTCRSH